MARKLQRYLTRALVGAILPPGIAAFYLVIYLRWLRSATSTGGIETGPSGASLIYYAWFIVGVFGLSLGEYALSGSEAGMLMTRSGRTPHGGHIMLHADKTWTGLGGWPRAIKAFWTWRSGPSFAWAVLAASILLSYIAFSLSGLTLELRTGYTIGLRPAVVYGANASTFNVPDAYEALYHAELTWKTGRLERLPGQSVIYTVKEREEPLRDLSTQGMPLIFVGPQSDSIISGRAWGVAAQYNCSVVRQLEDFLLYKYRNETIEREGASILGDRYKPWEGATFTFRNWTAFPGVGVAARLEMATSLDYWSTHINPWQYKQQNVVGYDSDSQATIDFVRDYPGLDKPAIIEAVLWQMMESGRETLAPGISLDLGTTVSDLYDTSGGSNFTKPGQPVASIGVSCICASATGQANIDGLRQTFSDFIPDSGGGVGNFTDRIAESPLILSLASYMIPLQDSPEERWVQKLFASVLADNAITVKKTNEDGNDYEAFSVLPRLLNSEDLRRSMLQVFGSYMNQLMYRGSQATTVQAARDGLVWAHESAVSAEKTLILGQGLVPPPVAAALLTLWATICLALAICYSFRRRWAEVLDSYSVIRFGVDAAWAHECDPADYPRDMHDCGWLRRLPGMIGDSCPGHDPGYIALADAIVDKEKQYF